MNNDVSKLRELSAKIAKSMQESQLDLITLANTSMELADGYYAEKLALESMNVALQQEIERTKQQHEQEVNFIREQHRIDKENFNSQINKSQEDIANLKSTIEGFKSGISNLMTRFQESLNSNTSGVKDIKEWYYSEMKEYKSVTYDMIEAKQKLDELEKDVVKRKKQIEEFENELNSSWIDFNKQKDALDRERLEFDSTKEYYEDIRTDYERLGKVISEKNGIIDTQKSQLEWIGGEKKGLEEEIRKLNSTISSRDSRIRDLENRIKDLEPAGYTEQCQSCHDENAGSFGKEC